MKEETFNQIQTMLSTIKEKSAVYNKKFESIDMRDVKTEEDFRNLPFTTKDDLREA